jgi:hypothetical protein
MKKAQRVLFQYHGELFSLTPELKDGRPYIDLDSLNMTLPGVRVKQRNTSPPVEELPERGTLNAFLSGCSREMIDEIKQL